jgi:hypothetical protein
MVKLPNFVMKLDKCHCLRFINSKIDVNSPETSSHEKLIRNNIMQQQVIIVGGGMVGLSLALMLAKSNIAVKLLEAVKYPNYDDENALIILALMRVIPHCHAVVYRFIKIGFVGSITTTCDTNSTSAYHRARQLW